jgi:hypothetical protein
MRRRCLNDVVRGIIGIGKGLAQELSELILVTQAVEVVMDPSEQRRSDGMSMGQTGERYTVGTGAPTVLARCGGGARMIVGVR